MKLLIRAALTVFSLATITPVANAATLSRHGSGLISPLLSQPAADPAWQRE